jgi:hypothetical protein
MRRFLDALFGCSHRRTTFPITLVRQRGPYVVCLDCGKEFHYSWKTMSIDKERTTTLCNSPNEAPQPSRQS